jgi:hypothetical protein
MVAKRYVCYGGRQRRRNFDRYLRGIDFPIGKQELLRRLKENGAPGVVVDQVGKRLPEGQYRSAQDLIKRLRN